MIEVGNHVVIIGGYEDCSDTWELNVVADQRLVDMHTKCISGDDVSYDDHESWLEMLPRFTFPDVVHSTYYVWLT